MAFSSGASLFIIASKNMQIDSAVFLAPALMPLNPKQRRKDKKNSNEPITKLTSQFTLYDA